MVTTLSVVWAYFFSSKPDFATMVVVALIPYNFLAYCLSGCATSIIGNKTLVKRVRFPRQILPISIVCTHLIHLGVQSILIVAAVLFLPTRGDVFTIHLLWLPLVLAIQLALAIGVGLMVSALNVFYRDVQYIVDSVLSVLFWVSPVVYCPFQEALFSEGPWIYYCYHLNPLAGILEGYRSILWYGEAPHLDTLAMSAAVTVITGYLGVRIFWRRERDFADMM